MTGSHLSNRHVKEIHKEEGGGEEEENEEDEVKGEFGIFQIFPSLNPICCRQPVAPLERINTLGAIFSSWLCLK